MFSVALTNPTAATRAYCQIKLKTVGKKPSLARPSLSFSDDLIGFTLCTGTLELGVSKKAVLSTLDCLEAGLSCLGDRLDPESRGCCTQFGG